MKKIVLALALCVGCGAVTPDESIEKTTGAFTYPVGNEPHTFATNWSCSGSPLDVMRFSDYTSWVNIHTFSSGFYPGSTHAITINADSTAAISVKLWELPLYPAMDGPYHVLYNTQITGAAMEPYSGIYGIDQRVAPPNSTWVRYPIQVPPYGIWIYAAGERSDYPSGVMVITVDPSDNPFAVGPDAWHGRCDHRYQLVTPL